MFQESVMSNGDVHLQFSNRTYLKFSHTHSVMGVAIASGSTV